MITIENAQVFGFQAAIRGMRNPKNSWAKSDSTFELSTDESGVQMIDLGPADLKLAGALANSGPDSCSTMHKIHAKEFTPDDFSCEHIGDVPNCDPMYYAAFEGVLLALNEARHCYLDTKDKAYWWQLIQLLPSSYNQRRTWDLNYAVLRNIYHARRNHKLDEWHTLCDWIETLPYAKELICG